MECKRVRRNRFGFVFMSRISCGFTTTQDASLHPSLCLPHSSPLISLSLPPSPHPPLSLSLSLSLSPPPPRLLLLTLLTLLAPLSSSSSLSLTWIGSAQSFGFTQSVAPHFIAASNLSGLMSTAMIRFAPAWTRPSITARPTAPSPNTAAVAPASTSAVFQTAPQPVEMPHPSRHTFSRGTPASTLATATLGGQWCVRVCFVGKSAGEKRLDRIPGVIGVYMVCVCAHGGRGGGGRWAATRH